VKRGGDVHNHRPLTEHADVCPSFDRLMRQTITDFVKASLRASLTAIGTRVSQEHRGDGDTSEDASTVTTPSELTENQT